MSTHATRTFRKSVSATAAIPALERRSLHIIGGEVDTRWWSPSSSNAPPKKRCWQCGTREPGSDAMTQITDATLNDGGGWNKLLWALDMLVSRATA